MIKYECTSCDRDVELDASGEFARNHRKSRKRRAEWCDGSGRAVKFLRRKEVD